MVRRFCKTLFALFVLLVVSSNLLIAMPANEMAASAQELYAPYWTSGAGWETRLQLKNNLATGSLTVTPVLRLASGKEISLDAVTIASNASATVLVDEGLLKRAPELLHEPDLYGSIVFRFSAANARNLYADAIVSLRDGPIEFHVTAFPTMEFEKWPRATDAGSQEGIWWQPRSGENDVLVVGNSSNKSLSGLLWLSDAAGKRWSQPLVLSAHETQRLDLHQLLVSSGLTGTYGGIRLEVPAFAGALRSIHFTYDEAAKTSAFSKMFDRDPAATLRERVGPGESRPWTMWAPMLALRNPDPALGLPSGTMLQPMVFIRNATAKTSVANISLTWRGESAKGTVKLEALHLTPFETRRIQLGAMQKQLNIPDDAHWALIALSSNGSPDDLAAIAISYDSTGRYGMESPFSDSVGAHFAGGEWRSDAGHNQLMSVTNGGNHPTEALLTLHYDDGLKKYELQETIQPRDQMWVNFAELIRNRVPDRNGQVLPVDLNVGTYQVESLTPEGSLIPNALALESTRGAIRGLAQTCCGIYSGSAIFFPDAVDLYFQDTELVYVDGTDSCSDQRIDISFEFTDWWSGIPAIATMSTGQATGVAAGTTSGYAKGIAWEGYGTNCAWVPVTVQVPILTYTSVQHEYPNNPLSKACWISSYFDAVRNQRAHHAEDVIFDNGNGTAGTIPVYGSAVYAMEAGTVIAAVSGNGPSSLGYPQCAGTGALGNYVKIKGSDMYSTIYFHVNPSVKVNDKVTAGQQIGVLDNSGCQSHAHLHVGRKDSSGNAVNFTIPCTNPLPTTKFDDGLLGCDVPSNL